MKVPNNDLDKLLNKWKQKNSLSESQINKIQSEILWESEDLDYNWWINLFNDVSLENYYEVKDTLKNCFSLNKQFCKNLT